VQRIPAKKAIHAPSRRHITKTLQRLARERPILITANLTVDNKDRPEANRDSRRQIADWEGPAFEHRAKLFLCLHFNGSQNATIRGSGTFYRAAENGNLNLDDDIALANAVHEAMISAMLEIDLRAKDRGVKPDNQSAPGALGVLNDSNLGNDRVQRMCRAAYIEVEFITNPAADRLLISGADAIANRTKVMAAVARACRIHMRGMPTWCRMIALIGGVTLILSYLHLRT
jgi:hypothetical protein